MFNDLKNLTALDIGCGYGAISNYIMKQVNFCVGVDLTPSVIYSSREHFPHGEYINANMLNLPFKDRTFDIIIAMEVLEHVPNTREGINEIYRVLKSGGMLVVTTPNYFNVAGIFKILFESIGVYKVNSWAPFEKWTPQAYEHFMTIHKMKNTLRKCGFIILEDKTFFILDGFAPFIMLLPKFICYSNLVEKLRIEIDSLCENFAGDLGLQMYIIVIKRKNEVLPNE